MTPHRRLRPALIPLAGLVLVLSTCTPRARPPADLVVSSFAPAAAGRADDSPIEIQFASPVVDAAELGAPLPAAPVQISPAVALAAHWRDRQTLVLIPQAPMAASTTYEVTLTGRLGERTGGFSFRFVNRPLVVEGVFGVVLGQLAPTPELPIHFDQPVDPVAAGDHCRLRDPAGGEPVALVPVTPGTAAAAQVVLRPARELTRGYDYELVCEGLTGAGGDTPLAEAFVLSVRTRQPLFVKSFGPTGRDVPADQVEISLELSNPVTLDDVRTHLRAEPAIPGLDQGWLDSTGARYQVTVDLKARTRYQLHLDTGLHDVHGQALSQPGHHDFATGDGRPRISMETGIYALEPSFPGYPVWSRNLRDFDVDCARVPKEKILALLTSSLDYDPWYQAGRTKALNWEKLDLSPRRTRVSIPDAKDNWKLDWLAMPETCGGDGERGLFLAELQSRHLQVDERQPWRYKPFRRVLANVTDLGVLLEVGPASGLVWVTSIAQGSPVPGARVTLYSPQGKRIHQGRTGTDGLLRIPGSTQLLHQPGEVEPHDFWSYRSQRLIAVVEKADDMAVVDGNWANGIQTWNFGVREDRSGGQSRVRGLIQSDRGIYRPGETVHVKGIVREVAEGRSPAVPKQRRIAVRVDDSRGQRVLDQTLPVSRFGGFHFDLALPAEASLGDYYVTATLGEQTFRDRFMVEEFRKLSYEVKLAGEDRHTRMGDPLAFTVSADYLFGAPLADAEVQWQLERRDHVLRFPQYPQYGFVDYPARGYDYYWAYDGGQYTDFVSDGTGKTDRRGKLAITARDEYGGRADAPVGPQDYLLSVTVRDPSDQQVSARTMVTAHHTDLYLGLHTQEFVQAVDMPFAVNAVAVDPTGKRVATEATLRFIRETQECDYTGTYRVYRTCRSRHEVALERRIDIPATGAGTERIMPKKPGQYIVRLEARDGRGNQVTSAGYVWVIGKGQAFWSGDESARMALVASKRRYQPGETARLVPRTDLEDATALVTVQRNGVIDAYVKPMASSAEGIEVAIDDAYAPNVFASVVMVAGRTGKGDSHRPQFKKGVVELEVSAESRRLQVEVVPDRAGYEPGQEVSGVIRVTAGGEPVRAEVSLSAADEGVLQLIGYRTPDPMKTFYASWGLGVDASTNWNRIARINAPAGADPDHGGDGPGAGDPVRSRFVSSAYWAPSLRTDARGEVRFAFTAPDDLTSFRLMAVAADTGSRFGSGDSRITVSKSLMATPVLPRFLNAGDQAEVGVLLHNHTDRAGAAVVVAKTEGVHLSQDHTRRSQRVPAGGSARVAFPIQAPAADSPVAATARFEFRARLGDHKDGVRVDIPVVRPLRVDRKTLASGFVARRGRVQVPVSWPGDLALADSRLSLTVDRTGLGNLAPSLRYLIRYPYGCLEQTLSRLIPLTKVEDLAASLGFDELRGPELQGYIRAGVAKVIRHQHADGHFSLWPSGQVYPHLTVYAVHGLNEARRAGITVPDDAIARGLAAIRAWSQNRSIAPGGDAATMAMATYLMAELGQPNRPLVERLYLVRQSLPRYGQAFLLRAMHAVKLPQADIDTVVNELTQAAVVTGDTAIVPDGAQNLRYYMSSDVRTTAMVLSALLEVAPAHPLIDQLALGLEKQQRPGGGWRNTQDNVYSLVALSDYARRAAAGSTTVTITLDGKPIERRRLDGAEVLVLDRDLTELGPGTLHIDSTDKVRYAVRLSEARVDLGERPEDRGFSVHRRYLDPATGLPTSRVEAGQLVKVQVEIKTDQPRRYVAVEDPLPAGFEAVNMRLASSDQHAAAQTRPNWGWTHTEMRDQRVLGFIDDMRAGTMTLEYLARATLPGRFTAPPARAEEMYAPENYGRSPAEIVTVSAASAPAAASTTRPTP
ncbi:MG2 domain-containing protein [Haliangium sp.]|uniref:alpha-2-macroglobulin family protein n=1 Tax=Haliangium sp. TaxID=2663208 RepID=UPI003D0D5922